MDNSEYRQISPIYNEDGTIIMKLNLTEFNEIKYALEVLNKKRLLSRENATRSNQKKLTTSTSDITKKNYRPRTKIVYVINDPIVPPI